MTPPAFARFLRGLASRTTRNAATRLLLAVGLSALVAGCSAEAKKQRTLERAEKFFAAGNYESARVEYLNVLRTDGNNATAHERLGQMWFDRGAFTTALPHLMKTRELSPGNAALRLKLGHALLAIGKAPLARREAMAVLEKSPGHGEALHLLAQSIRSLEDLNATQQELKKAGGGREDAWQQLAIAAVAARTGDAATAKRAVQRAVALDPKSHEARGAMAVLLAAQNDAAGAEKELKAAADAAVGRSPAVVKYAEFKAQTGRVDDAVSLLQGAAAKTPDYLPTWLALAQIAMAQKKYDDAFAALSSALKHDPTNYEAHVLHAQVSLTKGDPKKCIAELEQLGKAYRGFAADRFVLAKAYLQVNDTANAVNALKQTIGANPDHDEAMLLLAQLLLANGQAEQVLPLMVEVLTKRPGIVKAQLVLVDALRLLRRPDDAIAIVREQIRVGPKNPQPYFLLGLIQREQNKLTEARESFEKSLELAPDRLQVIAQLIDLDLLASDFAGAMRRARALVEKSPESADAQYMMGKVHAVEGKWDEAERSFFAAIERDPNHAAAFDVLSQAYVTKKTKRAPLERLEAFVAGKPQSVRGVVLLATVYTEEKQYTKARDLYEKVVAAQPNATIAMNNLAYLYAEHLDQLDRARELAQKAREADPNAPALADTLGWIHFKRREYPQALALLKEAAARLSTNGEVLYHLGMAHEAAGEKDAARLAYTKAVGLPDEFAFKATVKQRLADLGGPLAPAPATPTPQAQPAEPTKKS